MKVFKILTIATITLGLSQAAFANHHDGENEACHKKSGMLEMDMNNDGAVSHDEYTAAKLERAEKTFEHIDANKDGKLDAQEQAAAKAVWANQDDERGEYKKYHDPHHSNMPNDAHHQMMPDDENNQMPNDEYHNM
jgi:EF hand